MTTILPYLIIVLLLILSVILALGLINMMRGGSPNRSQKLMRLRVLFQFIAIIVMVTAVYFFGRI